MKSIPRVKRSYTMDTKVVQTKDTFPEYHTHRWRKIRLRIFARDNNCCVQCLIHDKVSVAKVCDHINPVRNYADFWDGTTDDNLQSLCTQCHNIKRASEKL